MTTPRPFALALAVASAACGGSSTPPAASAEDASLPDAGAQDDATTPTIDGAADAGAAEGGSGDGGPLDATAPPGWVLTWSDEFDGPDGSAVDPSKWVHDVGGGGWGNNELEYYTAGTANAVVSGGSLVITADTAGASSQKCWYGACKYVSARLTTSGKFSQLYGRFEARMKIPRGQGVWPAFWMLGQSYPGVDWPFCGEIDVMENVGNEPSIVHGTVHGPSNGPDAAGYIDLGITGQTALPAGQALADAFHVYATEWEAGVVRFYLDGSLYETVTPADLPQGATWVWDHPYFLLLNFAVGGDWPGSPDSTTTWPQTMQVDYVRAYRKGP